MSVIVSNNNVSTVSVSQNVQASQVRYFKLAVDTLFLRMENNLAEPESDHFFNNEDHIIEKADQITEMYENLSISDELKSELRQYILKEADIFDSKFSTTYDKIYIDNYLEFINISDFDYFEAEKIKAEHEKALKNPVKNKIVCDDDSESESEDQYKVKKCKEVVVDDSDSESDDESVSMFSETQSDDESEDDNENPPMCNRCNSIILKNTGFKYNDETDIYFHSECVDDSDDSDDEELDESEQFIKDTGMSRSYFDSFSKCIKCDYKQDDKKCTCKNESGDKEKVKTIQVIHFDEWKKASEDEEKEEQLRNIISELGPKVAVLTRENEVKDLNIKRLEAFRELDKSIINQFIQNSEKKDKRINELDESIWILKNKLDESEQKHADRLKKIEQSYIDRIEALKKSLEESKNMHAETANKLDESEQKLERNKEYTCRLIESKNDKIKELKDKYEGMYNDRQHFCKLNSDRWDELQKVKKQLEETIKVISNA